MKWNLKYLLAICVVISIIIISPAIVFTNLSLSSSELHDTFWICKEGQTLCVEENCSSIRFIYDDTYGYKKGRFNLKNSTGYGTFYFEWDYSASSKIVILEGTDWQFWNYNSERWISGNDWVLKLKIDFNEDNTEMVTNFWYDSNMPLNATIFDGITWIKEDY